MRIGDLVLSRYTEGEEENKIGVVIEVVNSKLSVPPVCKVLWQDGILEKEWWEDIEVIND